LAFVLLATTLSFYFELKSPLLRNFATGGTTQILLRSPSRKYIVRLEEKSPALKFFVLPPEDSIKGKARTSFNANLNTSLAASYVMDMPELTSMSRFTPISLLRQFRDTHLNHWEFLSLALAIGRFCNPAQIFVFEYTDKKEDWEHQLRLWEAPITHAKRAREQPLRVEVLNASSEPGLALKVTRALRNDLPNLDVIHYGNLDTGTGFSSTLGVHGDDLSIAKETLVSLNRLMNLSVINQVAAKASRGVDLTLVLAPEAAWLNKKLPSLDFLDTVNPDFHPHVN